MGINVKEAPAFDGQDAMVNLCNWALDKQELEMYRRKAAQEKASPCKDTVPMIISGVLLLAILVFLTVYCVMKITH